MLNRFQNFKNNLIVRIDLNSETFSYEKEKAAQLNKKTYQEGKNPDSPGGFGFGAAAGIDKTTSREVFRAIC